MTLADDPQVPLFAGIPWHDRDVPGVPDRPEWQTRAACRGENPDLWFPKQAGAADGLKAVAICHRCPVRQACLDYSLDTGQYHGIWGGLGERQRRRIRRQRRLAS